MRKSLLTTTGSLALIGTLTGLAAFGGTAMAATSTPAPTIPPAAVTQQASPAPATPPAAPSNQVTPSQVKTPDTEDQKPETEKDNIDYQEQGDHQGNNGVVEKNQAADAEKDSATEAEKADPDTDNAEVQQ